MPPLSLEPERLDAGSLAGAALTPSVVPDCSVTLSRVPEPDARSVLPESFRGGCSFGLPGQAGDVSRAPSRFHRSESTGHSHVLQCGVTVNRERALERWKSDDLPQCGQISATGRALSRCAWPKQSTHHSGRRWRRRRDSNPRYPDRGMVP